MAKEDPFKYNVHMKRVSIVVPAFNEAESIHELYLRLRAGIELLALAGVTSLSTISLYFAIVTGFAVVVLGMIYLVYILYAKFFLSTVIPGWSSVMSVVHLFGGVQMLILEIMGICISKIFWELNSHPPYLIEQVIKIPHE